MERRFSGKRKILQQKTVAHQPHQSPDTTTARCIDPVVQRLSGFSEQLLDMGSVPVPSADTAIAKVWGRSHGYWVELRIADIFRGM
jgi:hypothetical protein